MVGLDGGEEVTVAAVSRNTAPRSCPREASYKLQNHGRDADQLSLCALLYSKGFVGAGPRVAGAVAGEGVEGVGTGEAGVEGVAGRMIKAKNNQPPVRKMELPKFHDNRIHLYNGVGQARI